MRTITLTQEEYLALDLALDRYTDGQGMQNNDEDKDILLALFNRL